MKAEADEPKRKKLVEGIDFYYEGEFMVLTAHFLRRRGYCCDNGCRHCPYKTVEEFDYSK